MNNDTVSLKKLPASSRIFEYLAAKGKKARKAGTATTEEIALALDLPMKLVYDRLFWLAKRENKLLMIGSGKAAVWRSVPKARKAKVEATAAAVEAEVPTVSQDV